jgi:hypothetical protein
MLRTAYVPQPQNALSLSASGYSVAKSIIDITTFANDINASELETCIMRAIKFKGRFITNTSNDLSYGLNFFIIMIQYKSGATISEVEITANQGSLEQLLSYLSSSDLVYKVIAVRTFPNIVHANNTGTANMSAVRQLYKCEFTYKFPQLPAKQAAEEGFASAGTIHEEALRIRFYGILMRHTVGTAVSAVWDGAVEYLYQIQSTGRKSKF